MSDSVKKRNTTNFHITKNTAVFKNFLSDTNIFDRLLASNFLQHHKDINKQIIEQHIKTLSELPVKERIRKLEDNYTERKASFKFDPSIIGSNIEREKAVSKAIAGFSNTDGGILFIGVDNNGVVVGLRNDYSLVKDHNADGFQLELRNSIKHLLKNNIINDIIDIRIHKIDAEEICETIVYPSPVPIILTHDGKEEIYIREGNSTKPYSLNLATEYCIRHFAPQNEY
jgi:predicted HTH transcriptional regulator